VIQGCLYCHEQLCGRLPKPSATENALWTLFMQLCPLYDPQFQCTWHYVLCPLYDPQFQCTWHYVLCPLYDPQFQCTWHYVLACRFAGRFADSGPPRVRCSGASSSKPVRKGPSARAFAAKGCCTAQLRHGQMHALLTGRVPH
jgi:hypothetical protein